jgi:hypothetical protein
LKGPKNAPVMMKDLKYYNSRSSFENKYGYYVISYLLSLCKGNWIQFKLARDTKRHAAKLNQAVQVHEVDRNAERLRNFAK